MTVPSPGRPEPSRGPGEPAPPPLSAGGVAVLYASAVLYSLATAGALLVIGSLLLFAATTGAAASAAWAAAALVVLAAAHAALFAVLRGAGLPRPGATAALLTASVVLALLQTALMYAWFDVGRAGGPLFAAGLQGAAIALVLSATRGRAIGWAAAALCAVSLLRLLVTGGPDAASSPPEAGDRLPAITVLQYGAAVADAPGRSHLGAGDEAEPTPNSSP